MTNDTSPRHPRNDERGALAIITVLMVVTALTASVAILFQLSISDQADTTAHVNQALALDAAEGGVDFAESTINQATATTLPCGSTAQTGTVSSSPMTSAYTESITYYDTFPPSDAALSCSVVAAGTTTPAAAEIVSTGTTGRASAYMEALMKLTVSGGLPVFDDAMFSNATMSWQNNAVIDGDGAVNGNVYTNGSLTCANNSTIDGSLTAQGSFTGQNNCVVAGNLIAVGNVLAENNANVQGSVWSTGNSGCGVGSTQGNITLQNKAQIVQSAYAYCAISTSSSCPGSSCPIGGKLAAPDAGLSNPAVQTFPTVTYNAADWSGAGYTAQITNNTCSGAGSVYTTIAAMATATVSTVINTSCALSWANNSTITTSANLAIFSTGGFSMQNNTAWSSANSNTYDVYLIVPTGTSCSGSNGQISLQNNTSFASTVNMLFYTPCTLNISNNTTGYGQVYAGTISVANNFTAHYVPLPTLPGATGGGASAGGGSVSIGVSYVRQISSPIFE